MFPRVGVISGVASKFNFEVSHSEVFCAIFFGYYPTDFDAFEPGFLNIFFFDCGEGNCFESQVFLSPVNLIWKRLSNGYMTVVVSGMIEVWIDGLCEPVIPAHERTACLGYMIKRNGVIVDEGSEIVGAGKLVTNNVAEYTALIRALEQVRKLGLEGRVVVRSDSRLVVNQMRGEWKVKATKMMPLYHKAVALAKDMDVVFEWVPREENTRADSLARKAYEGARRTGI